MSTQPASGPNTLVKLGAARLTVLVSVNDELTVVDMTDDGATVKCTSPVTVVVAAPPSVTVSPATRAVARVVADGTAFKHEHIVDSCDVSSPERAERADALLQELAARLAAVAAMYVVTVSFAVVEMTEVTHVVDVAPSVMNTDLITVAVMVAWDPASTVFVTVLACAGRRILVQ